MSEPRTLLAIDHVSKNFGRVTAVDGISLDIRENEFFALLDPKWSDPAKRELIERGLALGAHIFDRLYRELQQSS